MVEVAGKPLLLWQVERLKDHGITDILMVIGHLGEKIQEYFGDGERFGVRIRYFVEDTPLGTRRFLLLFKGHGGGDLLHDVRGPVFRY